MGLKHWHPDTCPAVPGCVIEIDGKGGLVGFVRLCAFHSREAGSGAGEAVIFGGVVAKCREKERARHVAAEAIGERLPDDPDHFVLPDYRIDPENTVHILLPEWLAVEKA